MDQNNFENEVKIEVFTVFKEVIEKEMNDNDAEHNSEVSYGHK